MRPRLKLYDGREPANLPAPEPITIRLGDVTTILRDAVASDRTFLGDFEDEEIQISPDLYEVLKVYWDVRSSA